MSSIDGIDTNVNNYSLSELMAIVGLNDLSESNVKKNTGAFINKYKNSNPELSNFFSDIQSQLLSYAKGLTQKTDNKYLGNATLPFAPDAIYPAGEKQSNEWFQEQALQQNDPVQTDKITDRVQKIQVFGDYNHNPMNREQLGVANNYQVDVAQDTLNPNLKNTINKFINIDSQYRQYSSGVETSSTDYTLDLSETLNNALSIRLYSYQIPFSWYTIDVEYNNTCFWITDGSNNVPITMPSGNYLAVNFVNFLNLAFVQAGFHDFLGPPPNTPFISQYTTGPDQSMNYPVYYNSYNGIISIFLYGATYTPPQNSDYTSFKVSTETIITFFDPTSKLLCNVNCSNNNNYYNTTLGWLMGYRLPYVNVSETGNVATAILDLNGTKYLMLIVDDYNQNHINSNIVSIAEYSNKLKLPSYYSPTLLNTCIKATPNVSNIGSLILGEDTQAVFNDQFSPDGGILIAGKLNVEYSSTSQILPTAPRTLTQSQIYTINQINANNNNNTNYRVKAPTNNDVLAIISVSTFGALTGQIKIDNGSALQLNTRSYFGPVNIERLRIKLVNDKGNVVNLNGSDWCFTLICECLYQY
jgi:hypothetical protein